MCGSTLLLKITKQCSVVQMAIAVSYESPEDKKLLLELNNLKKMLDDYINALPQN